MALRKRWFKYKKFDLATSADIETAKLVAALLDQGAKGRALELDLASLESLKAGKTLLRKDPAWNRVVLNALVEALRHWQDEQLRVQATASSEMDRLNWHSLPGAEPVWRRRIVLSSAFSALCRRRLPLSDEDLIKLLEAVHRELTELRPMVDISMILKQAEFHAKRDALSEPVRAALVSMRGALDQSRYHAASKIQTRIDKLLAATPDASVQAATPPPAGAPPHPAPSGHANVLVDLKRRLGVLPERDIAAVDTEVVGPDQFTLRADSPLTAQHAFLSLLIAGLLEGDRHRQPTLDATAEGRHALDLSPRERGQLLLAACERAAAAYGASNVADDGDYAAWYAHSMATRVPSALLETELELDRDDAFDALLLVSAVTVEVAPRVETLLEHIETLVGGTPLTDGERYTLHRARCVAIGHPPMGVCPPLASRLCTLLNEPDGFWVVPGEHWADVLHADLAAMDDRARAGWHVLLHHAATATASKPTKKWCATAMPLIDSIGTEAVHEHGARWMQAVTRGRSIPVLGSWIQDVRGTADTINEGGATILRGLVWMTTRTATAETPRRVADLLLTSVQEGARRRTACRQAGQRMRLGAGRAGGNR